MIRFGISLESISYYLGEKNDEMKTHSRGAALQQFASEGEVASSLVLSYTLVPVQEEEGNAPVVSSVVYSPQVGTMQNDLPAPEFSEQHAVAKASKIRVL